MAIIKVLFAKTFFKNPTNYWVRSSINTFRQLFIAPLLLAMLALSASADDTALVFSPAGKLFDETIVGLSSGLDKSLKIEKLIVEKTTKSRELAAQIDKYAPKIIILIGNNSVKLYREYQKARGGQKFPPSVTIATLFIDKLLPQLNNATGIRYEVSVATGVGSIQPALQNKIERVGVIHREWMTKQVEAEIEYSASKGIELVPYVINEKAIPGSRQEKQRKVVKEIQRGLKQLKSLKVDALWVLNDNALINASTLRSGWSSGVRKLRRPVIVGVETFAKSAFQFGSFAVVPDHRKLGIQTAGIVRKIKTDGWTIKNPAIQRPTNVLTTINTTLTQKNRIPLVEGQLAAIDNVIE